MTAGNNEDGDDVARELDAILDSYGNDGAKQDDDDDAASEERGREFLERFERIKVEIVKPAMEEIGKYLEKKGHSFEIKDNAGIYVDNPSVKMEVYPKIPPGDTIQEREFPTISFIAEPDVAAVGIEVQDGMPGRPGLTRGRTTDLDSLTKQYVKAQVVAMIKSNFANKRPGKR